MIGLLALSSVMALMLTLSLLWQRYQRQLMSSRMRQLNCLGHVVREYNQLIYSINQKNQMISAARLSPVSPGIKESTIRLLQAHQQYRWLQHRLYTLRSSTCPRSLALFLPAAYRQKQGTLERNTIGLAIPVNPIVINFPLSLFGPVPRWWRHPAIRLRAVVANTLSLGHQWERL